LPGKRDYRGWRIVPDERQAIEILQGLFLVEISGDIKKTDLKGGKKDEYL
jgi:hypothetical protein